MSQTRKLTRQELALVPTPAGTATHRPVPHIEVVNALMETLGFRHIGVHREEYAASKDGMKFYGVLDLATTFEGCRFSLAVRNSHDKSMRLSMVVGYRVFCCDNGAFSGDFEPIAAKHSKHFNLVEAVDIGVSQMQRNFEPMVKAVDRWRASQITDVTAKLMIYEAFVEGATEFPGTSRTRSTAATSNPSTRSSSRAPRGACRTPSRRRSSSSTRSRRASPAIPATNGRASLESVDDWRSGAPGSGAARSTDRPRRRRALHERAP